MFGYCGISCVIFGVLFGSYFGDLPIAFMQNMLGIPADQLPNLAILRGEAATLALIFDPLQNPMGFLIFGLAVGAIHLFAGMAVNFVLLCKDGKVLDTSMGFTPLAGVMMGTRCGDIDPAIVPFIMEKENLTPAEADTMMNKKSGFLGVSGVSSDCRDLEAAIANGNERAKLAMDMLGYQIKKFIGSYAAALNGVDAIVFTAGLGENDHLVREDICSYLGSLGVTLDLEANKVRGKEVELSTPDSKVKVMMVPTNEELAIARETLALVK